MNDIFLPRPGTSSFDLTARLYGGEDAWLRAKNNGRTELDYVQWVQVRTPEFKDAYGNWEGWLHKQFLEGDAICHIYGNEIPEETTSYIKNVTMWYDSKFNGIAHTEEIGTVNLRNRSVKDSYAHGPMGNKSNKYYAFAAVPDVLKEGAIVGRDLLRNAHDNSRYFYFAAPVEIKKEGFVCVVTVKSSPHSNRIYVHEVGAKKELQAIELTSGTYAAYAGMNHGPIATGAIKSVLQRIYLVKSEQLRFPCHPTSGEPTRDFLLSRKEPPLIDLRGLCPREAGRKLFEETQGDIRHLALMEASAASVGLRLDKEAIRNVQGQHPLAIHDVMLKALRQERQPIVRTRKEEKTR